MAVTSTQRSLELLNATFELEELVSSRSTLEVFRARDLRDGCAVWVQRLRPELARKPKEVARFETRARSLEALVHRCLPRVCVDADDSGLPFVVQELVEGRPLADLIGAFPQGVPLPLLAAVAAPVIEALALAHAVGVNHGAIDPAHVMLLGPLHDPSARLVGLDVASHELSVQDKAYRAPELTGAASAGPAADVFACGVLLYQMLSGVLPFQAGTRSAVPLDELAPQVPAGFVQLTAACLSEDPRQRPVDAGALYRRLVACCDIAPRRGAANAQATRADTGVHSERAAPKVSGRAPRAGVPAPTPAARAERAPRAGVQAPASPARADNARRTAPTSHRAEPTPLASERVRKSPTRYADNEAPRTALSPEHAAELLSAKREASSRSPRMSAPPQAQALRSTASEPSPSPRQPQPPAAEANVPPRASTPSGQPAAGASVHPRASQVAAANAAPRASRPSAQPAADTNVESRASQSTAAGANPKGRASPLPAAGAHVESRAKPSGQPAAGASVHPRASQAAAANAAPRASRPSAQPAVGAGAAMRSSQPAAANAGVPPRASRPSAVPGDARGSLAVAAGEGAEARSLPPTAAEAGAATRPSRPSAKPAIELSRAQLDALALLRHKYDEQEERDRWVAVLFALLLLLLLSIGAPFFLDSGLAVAHATFGPKLRLAATAFSIATVVGALHPLLARAGHHWFVQRLRGAVTQATALDFVVITSSLYSSAPSITSAADFGQRWLLWGVGLSLLLLALEYLLRGARNLAHDLRYSALIFAMAFLSCFGSYRAVMRALEHEKQRAAQLLARTKQSQSAAESGTNDAQTTPAGDRGVGAQRSGLGDNEAHDLAPAQELEQKHQQDSTAIERLNQKLPAPTEHER